MQTFLDTFRRPVVQFDVTNEEHRMHMAVFLKYGTWSKCPYAFYSPNDISVKAYAIEMLAEYYINQEFKDLLVTAHVPMTASVKVKFSETATA